jgi:hypothetical protein
MTQDAPKRPGRPPKIRNTEEMENPMTEATENTAENHYTAPVSRGLREAAIRAAELREKMRDDSSDPTMYDDFYIDPRKIPEGWDYNWKRESIAGMTDDEHMIEMRGLGWEPVDVRRHPEMMPPGYVGAIRKRGMILMERPMEISDMAKQREIATARELVVQKEKSLGIAPAGTIERDKSKTGVRKSYEPMQIPRT